MAEKKYLMVTAKAADIQEQDDGVRFELVDGYEEVTVTIMKSEE